MIIARISLRLFNIYIYYSYHRKYSFSVVKLRAPIMSTKLSFLQFLRSLKYFRLFSTFPIQYVETKRKFEPLPLIHVICHSTIMLSVLIGGSYLYVVHSNSTTNIILRMTQVLFVMLIILLGCTHRYKIANLCTETIKFDEKFLTMGFIYSYR